MDRDDAALGVLLDRGGHDDVAVAKTHGLRGRAVRGDRQAAEAFGRHFGEVALFNPKFLREGDRAGAHFGLLRMIVRHERFRLAFRIVVDDELQGAEHRDAARRTFFKVFAKGLLQNRVVDPTARDA